MLGSKKFHFETDSTRIALRDAAILVALCVAGWLVIERTDTCTRFFQYVAAHPDTELDSVILAGILSALGVSVFAWRRWVESARAERISSRLANSDALTGLPNRRAFTKQLEAAAKQETSFACLLLDLDNFKQVNDLRGHVTGDRLLQSVAARIRAAAPHVAVARIGGDEFALLAGSGTDPTELAHRISETVATPLRLDGHLVRVSVSTGIARFPDDGGHADTLLRKADMAMYRAKAKGPGRVQRFEQEMEERDRRYAEVAEALGGALTRGEVVPHYQPLVDLKTGAITGFEVLSRWESSALGTVTPGEFIPVATETGLIDQLTCSLLERSCANAASWSYPYRISFNLAPAQLSDRHTALQILAILYRTGLDPKRLEIELTEEALLVDGEEAAACLSVLKVEGITLALDDFGSGYSSMHYLRMLPFDKVKIDRGYVSNIAECAKARRMVGGIISFAHALNIPLIAEGVETSEQAVILKELGCDMAQGWLYGKAIANDHLQVGKILPNLCA